jgi:putative peptidoglycan lipid II flippase
MTLVRSAGVIGAATMASRILGLVRDQVLAYFFGAGDAMDAFRIAFRLPNLFRDLFAEGALSAAMVPTFARAMASGGREHAWRLASNVANHLLIVSGVTVLLGIALAEPLVDLYAGAFRGVPGKFELTVRLTRIMFPFLSMVALAAVLTAVLNTARLFFVPALSPAMFNAATIVCAVVFVPLSPALGVDPIVVIAAGALAGGLGQIALQIPAAAGQGFRYRAILDTGDPWLREIGRLMIPGVVGLAAVQINLLVNSWLATGLGTGAVSWLDYAFRLMYLPIGLVGVSIATAALPAISGDAGRNDRDAVRRGVSSALRMMLMLNIPATVGLVVLATPIVSLIFERGRFAPSDTAATAAALAFYAPGLLGYSVVKLASPAFYALGNSRVPVAASAVSVGFNILASVLLVDVLGHRGLALSTAMAALLNGGVLLWLLSGRLGGLEGGRLAKAALKISAASMAMAIAAYSTERVLRAPFGSATVVAQASRVFTYFAAGIAVLAAAAYVLRIEEFQQLIRRLSTNPRT